MIDIKKIWIEGEAIYVQDSEGNIASEPFSEYPRLSHATPSQRMDYETDSIGIHWPSLDEDLAFENFFNKKEKSQLYSFFIAHPEINVSALARQMGISQVLMAQYASGSKTPSKNFLARLQKELRELGKKLCAVSLR